MGDEHEELLRDLVREEMGDMSIEEQQMILKLNAEGRKFLWPEWFRAQGSDTPGKNATDGQQARVMHGLHPMGFTLSQIEGARCGNCAKCYHHPIENPRRRYYKCRLMRHTHGPGSDVRLKWRGCSRWERQEDPHG